MAKTVTKTKKNTMIIIMIYIYHNNNVELTVLRVFSVTSQKVDYGL